MPRQVCRGRRALASGILFAAMLAISGCSALGLHVAAASQPLNVRPLARLEPASGVYFGVSLDFGSDSAGAFATRLGRPAAVYVAFTHFPITDADSILLDQFIQQVHNEGAIALLTAEPTIPLDDISEGIAVQLAERMNAYNASGVRVMLRFAHEMNGSWYAWGQQPTAYTRAFRIIASAVHEHATDTAMLWAPNYGAGYPFQEGPFLANSVSPDFQVLDTNHNGILDSGDDPYAPYYPGDDAVDWVGMTLYHWGDQWPWGKNIVPEPGKFVAQLTGTYNGAGGDERGVPDFHHLYAVGHGKPLAVPETAAFYNTTVGGDSELAIKQAWWRQVYDPEVLESLPDLKMINWFEWRKPEVEVNNALVDWTATRDPGVRAAFLGDVPFDHFVFGTSQDLQEPTPVSAQVVTPAFSDVRTPPVNAARSADPERAATLRFSGHDWDVRATDTLEGPGPNYFANTADHVWVDDAGRLHLRVAPETDGKWYSAEVASREPITYGRLRFTVDQRLDDLDPNVVLGLFSWSDDPAQNHRELDIEFGRFGHPDSPLGRYTRQPYTDANNLALFNPPDAAPTSHELTWLPGRASFVSWIGDTPSPSAETPIISSRTFEADVPDVGDSHVHINLWLDAGNPPTDGQPVEMIIRDCAFDVLPG